MASLASVQQLASYMQLPLAPGDATAQLMLDIASDMVRDFLVQQLDPSTADVALLDPIEAAYVVLPQLPVVSVALVETYDVVAGVWTTQTPSTYTVSRRLGMISALPGCGVNWPNTPESWRITYAHGFATGTPPETGFPAFPQSLLGVVLGVAARAYSSPASIEQERIGGYQVKYAVEAEGFSALELKALRRYRNGSIS